MSDPRELPTWYRSTTGFQLGIFDERERITVAIRAELDEFTNNPERLDSADARAFVKGLKKALLIVSEAKNSEHV